MLTTEQNSLLYKYSYHEKCDPEFLVAQAIEDHEALLSNREYMPERLGENDLIEIFGKEGEQIISEKIAEYETIMSDNEAAYNKWLVKVYSVPAMRTADELKQWFWTEGMKEAFFNPCISTRDGKFISFVSDNIKRLKRLQGVKDRKIDGWLTDSDIATAKQVPIETFLDGKFRAMGGRLMLLCPFHNERHASFVVYLKTNTYNCFGGCGDKGGDVIKFVMKKYELDFIKAVKFILKQQ